MKSLILELLLNDGRMAAIAKPAGLASIPGRGETTSVLDVAARQLRLPCAGLADPRARVVHRLDKETSGVMLLAKDIDAQRSLSMQFQNNAVDKEYLAIVVGQPTVDEGEIDAPLARHPNHRDRMAVVKNGRPARTGWRVEQRMRRFTLLRCFPRTGRTHQIRVHLRSIGMPLAIDPLYNPASPRDEVGIFLSQYKRDYRPTAGQSERPLIARLTLHAERIRFTHPEGQPVTLHCPPPKDFRATVQQLGKL